MTEPTTEYKAGETWAIAELMGHLTLAGRITKPGENGGLWQIDIPDDTEAGYHTEFFASGSVYRIRIVSEEIARAYSRSNEIVEYAAPIVTRAEHEAAMERAREIIEGLKEQNRKLLMALPASVPLLEHEPEEEDNEPKYVPVDFSDVGDPEDPDDPDWPGIPNGNTF